MALLDFLKRKNKKEERRAREKSPKAKTNEREAGEEVLTGALLKEKTPASLGAAFYLISPHVTEKSTRAGESGTYTFKVSQNANKPEIKKAVEELYGVRVDAVHIIYIPLKRRFSRGRAGVAKGYKKAMVTLAKGEKIEVA
ncbi:MAG: 50S ribosomal protein L23 [Patescibacteria group bacterium]